MEPSTEPTVEPSPTPTAAPTVEPTRAPAPVVAEEDDVAAKTETAKEAADRADAAARRAELAKDAAEKAAERAAGEDPEPVQTSRPMEVPVPALPEACKEKTVEGESTVCRY